LLLGACEEEERGQYPVDSTAPQKVSNPVVKNIKGGAVITYTLPNERDILYVKAEYTLPNGQKKEMRSSAFTNSIQVLGFSRAVKTKVNLISVDRSRNESEPVVCDIEPLDSPIYDVLQSLNVIEGFGGIKLNWLNEDKADVVIGVLMKDEDNIYQPLDNIYTSAPSGSASVRGIEEGEKQFGIYVRDIYNNYTDTLYLTMTPWKESELDKKQFRAMTLCSSFTLSQYGTTNEAVLWDGAPNVSETGSAATMYYVNSTGVLIFVSIDLGVNCKLSRFKFWGRRNYTFTLHHPREFEIWGTSNATAANDPCSFDGWELLLTGESVKPSGNVNAVTFAELPSEDVALAAAGEEYEFPLEIPKVRWVRFRCLRTWTNSQSCILSELTFWGNPD